MLFLLKLYQFFFFFFFTKNAYSFGKYDIYIYTLYFGKYKVHIIQV